MSPKLKPIVMAVLLATGANSFAVTNDVLGFSQHKKKSYKTPVSTPATEFKGAPYEIREIEFKRTPQGEARIEMDLSSLDAVITARRKGNAVLLDFGVGKAQEKLLKKLDVSDRDTPVQTIDTFAVDGKHTMIVSMQGAWEYKFRIDGGKAILEIRKGIGEVGEYVGDKITLDFQNISVRDALNVVADFTGMNVVISDSVSGNLSLRLKEVPWDQALDIILQSRGLDSRIIGNVIQIAPKDELDNRVRAYLTAKRDIADMEDVRTESYQLSYQKAANVANLLANKDQRVLSKRGSAVVDDRTNTLFVQDVPSRLEEVKRLLKKVDVPVRQVLVEAKFYEVTDNFNQTLGGKFGYNANGGNGFQVAGGNIPVRGNVGLVSSLPGAVTGLGGATLALFNPAMTKNLMMELLASETDGKIRSISSPRVVTADKAEATVESGTEIPYQQATQSGATSVQFKKATLSLKVTPQVTPDGKVILNLKVNQDTVGTIFNGVPSINTKNVTTQVLVENGGTVVVGGVQTDDSNETVNKIPLLGDVPLFGNLFKNANKIKNKKQLMVFITPHVLKDVISEDDLVKVSEAQKKEM